MTTRHQQFFFYFLGLNVDEPQIASTSTCEASSSNVSPYDNVSPVGDVEDNSIILVEDEKDDFKIDLVDHKVALDDIVTTNVVEPTIKTEPVEEISSVYIKEETIQDFVNADIITNLINIKNEPDDIKEVEGDNVNVSLVDLAGKEEHVYLNQEVKLEEQSPNIIPFENDRFTSENTNFTPIPMNGTERTIIKHDCSSQTDIQESPLTIDLLLEKTFEGKPVDMSEAVSRMIKIDEWVAKLTKYRQDMFTEFASSNSQESSSVGPSRLKRRRIEDKAIDRYLNDVRASAISDEDDIEEITFTDIDYSTTCDKLVEFQEINDVIVEMKVS